MKPVLFNTPMVRAILDGRKTQTARPPNHQLAKCNSGDILYVREAFRLVGSGYEYMADDVGGKFKPCIHMPRTAARLFLRVTRIRYKSIGRLTQNDAFLDSFKSVAEFRSAIIDIYGNLPKIALIEFVEAK